MNSTDVSAYIDLDTFPSSGDEDGAGSSIVAGKQQPIASTSYLPMDDEEGLTTAVAFNEGNIDSTSTFETVPMDPDLPAAVPSVFRESAPDAASMTMMLGGDDVNNSDEMDEMMTVDDEASAVRPQNGFDRLSADSVNNDSEAEVEDGEDDADESEDEELVQSVNPSTLVGSSTHQVEMETDVAVIDPALIAEPPVASTSTAAPVAPAAPTTSVKKKVEPTMTSAKKVAVSTPAAVKPSVASKPKSAVAQGKAPATSFTAAKPSKSTASKSITPIAASSGTTSAANGSAAVAPTENQVWIKMYDSQLRDILAHLHTTKTPLVLASRLAKGLSHFSFGDTSSQVSPWGDQSVIPPSDRLAILTQMLQNGTNEFWSAFAAAPGDEGIKTIKVWLWGASLSCASAAKKGDDNAEVDPSKGKGKGLEGTLVPILKALDKLPLTINHLKTYELGKRVRRVDRGSKNKEAVKLARELVNKWQELASSIADSKNEASSKKAASAPTKRKTPDSSSEAPVKKLKTVTTGKTAVAEPKKPVTGTAATTAKKAAPSTATSVPIKKVPVVVANPLQKMLAQMKFDKKRTSEPAPASATASTSSTVAGTAAATTSLTDKMTAELRSTLNPLKLKNKKKVHWPLNDVDLNHIRIIENCLDGQRQRKRLGEADGEGAEAEDGGFDSLVRDMNEREGAVMTQGAVMEEEVAWYEPLFIEVPDTADFNSYHTVVESEEAAYQAQREMGRPEYLYDESNPETQMESPAEPQPDAPADEEEPETKEMTLSSEMTRDPFVMQAIANAQALSTPTQGYLQEDQLQSLLGNLVSMQEHHQQQQQQHLHHAHAGPSAGPEQTGVFDEQALAKLRAVDPALIQSIVNQHPQELGMLANELSQRATFPVQLELTRPLPHSMLSWQQQQQQQTLVSQAPQLTLSHQYNGYVPPASSSTDSQASKMKGKKAGKGAKGKVTKCRFFNTPRGCDMGTKCRFKHEF